ncbi:MAG: hypothetical protein IPO83_01845 [Chitinophagaceae bacterium]|nr:hypothetical protein [Chitinophagaceae bacterium]
MEEKSKSSFKKYPEAWKVYIDCVHKWKVTEDEQFPNGWKYGIPNPENRNDYLYSDCPAKLFIEFKNLFYQNHGIIGVRTFLWRLEKMEGKISKSEYESNLKFLERI